MAEERQSVAIVGFVARFPGAENVAQFWENLRNGKESVQRFDREVLRAAGTPSAFLDMPNFVPAAPVLSGIEAFDARFFGFCPRDAELMDPQFRLFLEASWEALEVAGHDPTRFNGRIGLYAGASAGTYLLGKPADAVARFGALRVGMLNDPDNLPTLVAHKLDLRGPAIHVAAQCATSLVAVHLACQSLMTHECDMALAGGVTVHVPNKRGYLCETGGWLSPDGRCRPFDAEAGGTVLGDGLGIVVLRRLDDAVLDGDTIRAVLRGWAVNNEGARRAGYPAPSVDGQAEVVAEALAMAEISADDIRYVEATGNGTPLGDATELSALTETFRTYSPRVGFCGIGAVKSNIGHAGHAAGAAALIKTVLAMEHGEIPPTLHYRAPHPRSSLAASPFFVVAKTLPWPSQDVRRAGVSAMGIGGTNAHVVLERPAIVPASDAPRRRHHLLVLSAKTASALEAMAARWLEHLAARPSSSLADIAFTSRVGRKAFAWRLAVTGADVDEIVGALRAARPSVIERSASVAFAFPGEPSGTSRGLYDSELVFRASFDRCRELVRSEAGADLADTTMAHADLASFAASYALCELWRSVGIEPAACFGRGVGEYLAAHVAGMMSLEDALRVVSARATADPAELARVLSQVKMQQPSIPCVSGVTAYSDGVAALCATPGQVLLEIGGTQGGGGDQAGWLAALGSLWVRGVEVAWDKLTEGERRRRVPLPTYPFERRRFWLEDGASAAAVDPRARPEQVVAAIWSDLLGVDAVGPHDDFIELGGHSLLASQLLERVREQLGIALSLSEFFENPTISAILRKTDETPNESAEVSSERDEFEV